MTDEPDDRPPATEPRPWAPLDAPVPPPGPPTGTPPPGGYPPPPGYAPQSGYGYPPYAPPLPKAGSSRTGPLPLHPMALGDILDGAFKLLKANARTVLIVVAVIVLPLQLGTSFLIRNQLRFGLLDVMTDPSVAEAAADQPAGGEVVAQMVAALLGIIATPFIAGAVSRVVAASYLGEQIGPSVALRAAGRRFWPLLASFMLVHLVEGIGFVLCVLPGLAAMAMYTLVAPAIVVEELGPIQGMARSWRLVRHRFWPVLGISLLAGFIASTIANILSFVPLMAALIIGGAFAWLLLAVGGILASIVSAPIVAIIATLLYFDARIRHEGFDLQVIAREMGSAGAG